MVYKQLVIVIILIVCASTTVAAGDFTTNLDTTYTLTSTSELHVQHQLSVTNNSALLYPTSFQLTIPGNIRSAITTIATDGKAAHVETEKADRFTKLTILFTDPIVGIGKKQTYTIGYQNPNILFGSYPVPQFILPALPNLDSSVITTTRLIIPEKSCATPSAFPAASSIEKHNELITVTFLNNPTNQSIFMRCADNRYVSIVLHYYLTNSNMTPIETQITLPPDTNHQHIYYDQINPAPLSISSDNDGNIIASFKLEPKESKRITVNANAIIAASSLPGISVPDTIYLLPKTYWPSSNTSIKNMSKELPDAESIYRYLLASTTLDPTTSNKRFGGMSLVSKPASMQPVDLIDSFITLTRAKGIMSRRLIGFSLSPDPILWPTTLLENTLHLWTEYYDNTSNEWIQLDPLWEKTSMANFFPIRDVNHIVLAINGVDDTVPYPVGYYQSPGSNGPDIQITDREPFTTPPVQIDGTIEESLLHVLGLTQKARIIIKNRGLFSLYNEPISLIIDNNTPEPLILHRLPLQGQAIIPINLPKQYEQAILTIGTNQYQLKRTKSALSNPLIFTPFLAGFSGILAVISRRLLVSRRKR